MYFIFRKLRRIKKRRKSIGKNKYLLHKESARVLVHGRILILNEHYRVNFGRIAIRNSRSRWGSCSRKGNLNFNYKLVFLPLELVDYVIVHELCHLKEFNHSPRFWAHVAETHPQHKNLRKKLKEVSRNSANFK